MRFEPFKALCLIAAVLLSAASCSATALCEHLPSQWHLARTRDHEEHIFVRNVVKRACALHSGSLKRASWDVSIEGASSWEETALVITAAATDAYIHDHPLQLSGNLPDAVSSAEGGCDINTGCLFGHPSHDPQSNTEQQQDTWDSQRVVKHYLRGAGLLWLRERTSDVSGCHLAAAFARLHLQPAGTFRELLDSIVGQMADSRYNQTVVVNVDSVHTTLNKVQEALDDDRSTGVWLVGTNTRVQALLDEALPSVDVHFVDTSNVPLEAQTAVWAYTIAHSTHYIGDLEPLFVKIGLVLGLGTYGSFPKIVAGNSSWNDAYGFASCTAEEFNAHMKVASGSTASFKELLGLPPQPPIPHTDYIASAQAHQGRNSDEQCEGLSFDSTDNPVTVDELLRHGEQSSDACKGTTTPPLCSTPDVNFALPVLHGHDFAALLNETARNHEYRGTAATQRCGFQAQSGFNLLGAYNQFKQCKVVVATVVSRGRDVLLNPVNVSPDHAADPRVCFVAAMDINGLLTHQLQPPADGGLMQYGHWTVVALLNSPWEGTTEMPWLRGARDANVLRHLRFRVFPVAEYSMWIDGKHQLAIDPVKLFEDVLNKPGKQIAVFHHENQRCVFAEHDIIKGLDWTFEIPGYRDKIDDLTARYHNEGMPAEAEGAPQGAYDLAIIINRHTTPSNLLACLAYTEIESFTSRNQLHYPYTVWRSKAKPILNELPNCALWKYTNRVGRWDDYQGKLATR